MRDILSGGVFEQAIVLKLASLHVAQSFGRRRRACLRRKQATRRRLLPHVVPVQPGQLVSPHMKHGFPSLLIH